MQRGAIERCSMSMSHCHTQLISCSLVTRFQPDGLNTSLKLLPEYLQEAGYATHAVGKWHLGYCHPDYLPTRSCQLHPSPFYCIKLLHPCRRGFDSHFGSWQQVTNYYTRMTETQPRRPENSNPDKVTISDYCAVALSENISRWVTTGTRMRSCPMRGGEISPQTWCPGQDQGDTILSTVLYCTVHCTVLYCYQEGPDPDRASQFLPASVPVRGVPGGPRSSREAPRQAPGHVLSTGQTKQPGIMNYDTSRP